MGQEVQAVVPSAALSGKSPSTACKRKSRYGQFDRNPYGRPDGVQSPVRHEERLA